MATQEATQHRGVSNGGRHAGVIAAARRSLSPRRGNGGVGIPDERLATALGWFSIGLGLAELAAPGGIARLIGVRDDATARRTLQAVGLREIASGVGILTRPRRPAGWVWSRVAGDVMDLALLGTALASDRNRQDRVAAATAAVIGVTVLDVLCGQRLSERPDGEGRRHSALADWTGGSAARDRAIRFKKAITIGRPAEELYRFWRDFENLPRVIRHLEAVQVVDDGRSHWKAQAPLGRTVEWDSEITEDRPNERIAWRSVPGADVTHSGTVTFERASGGRGTVVRVEMCYDPPGGIIGATFAKLFGNAPDQEIYDGLRRFKQVMETGEIVQSDATAKSWGSAQPPAVQHHARA